MTRVVACVAGFRGTAVYDPRARSGQRVRESERTFHFSAARSNAFTCLDGFLQAAQGSNAGPDSSAEADACAPCTRASRGPCLLPRLLSAPGSGRRRMAMLPGCQPQRKDFKPQMAANQWIHLESGTPPRTLHLLCLSPEQYLNTHPILCRRPELSANHFNFLRSRPAQEIPTL